MTADRNPQLVQCKISSNKISSNEMKNDHGSTKPRYEGKAEKRMRSPSEVTKATFHAFLPFRRKPSLPDPRKLFEN